MSVLSIEDRVMACKAIIQAACSSTGLNITIYDGKLGFVDPEAKKIVALWEPVYELDDE